MQHQLVPAALLAAALALSCTPAFATNLSAATSYPGMNNAAEHLPPVSQNASNITAADMHSDIAPPLPMPAVGDDAAPLHYLHVASRDLSQHQTGAAQQALEMAETRLLDRSVIASTANEPDQSTVVGHISNALEAIGTHNLSKAQDQINLAMSGVRNRTAV